MLVRPMKMAVTWERPNQAGAALTSRVVDHRCLAYAVLADGFADVRAHRRAGCWDVCLEEDAAGHRPSACANRQATEQVGRELDVRLAGTEQFIETVIRLHRPNMPAISKVARAAFRDQHAA